MLNEFAIRRVFAAKFVLFVSLAFGQPQARVPVLPTLRAESLCRAVV
jgi:hypothetical protein